MSNTPTPQTDTPLLEHLIELRKRLLHAIFGVLIIAIALSPFANTLYQYLAQPLIALLPAGSSMIATEVASPFLVPFKLVLFSAICLSTPWIAWQVWQFVAPGLYKNEKRLLLPMLATSIILFYTGIAFAYWVIFPIVFAFLTQSAPQGVQVMTDINQYLSFVLVLFLAFGCAFQLPVITVALIQTGVATVEGLKKKRPFIIIGCFTIGMFLTPPDVISQTLLAIPMWLLFETGIIAASIIKKPHTDKP